MRRLYVLLGVVVAALAAPAAALAEDFKPEDEFKLIHRYAADEPEAIAEVRRRNAERRAQLCP